MNQHLHRLVYSRRLGMLVAVAEGVRAGGKSASGARRSAVTVLLLAAAAAGAAWTRPAAAQTRPPVVFASRLPAPTAPLPVPYGSAGGANTGTPRPFVYDPAKGSGSADLYRTGQVGWDVHGNSAVFDQRKAERVVINWDSFNIGAGYKLHFAQDKDPAKYVSALNRIWSADPSVILGSLTADREVILLNANGVYFGRGARVDTGKFVATALNIADGVFDKGLRNVTDGSAVFSAAGSEGYAATNLDAGISVEAGAELRSAAGGDVLLFAPRVLNQGRIETPAGQAVLAAGDKVYLMSSSDPAQRGLIVAVDPVKVAGVTDPELGVVENGTSGLVDRLNEIRAESGSVNLVGLTVRQNGQVSATTAVKGANGAIYLQAMASTTALAAGSAIQQNTAGARGLLIEPGTQVRVGAQLGTVQIGPGSSTVVSPDSGAATQIDAEAFNPSRIRVEGQAIHVAQGAQIRAAGGRIELLAAADSVLNPLFDSTVTTVASAGDGSRIVVGPDAVVSAAGLADVAVDGARNQGSQRLFRIELADAPVQRSGPLYRSQVYFDLRDGSKITAANLAGAAASIGRTASERSTAGGSVRIEAEGAVVLGDGASVDVSGGSVHYAQSILQNSLVVRDGHVIAFKAVAAGTALDALLATPQRVVTPAYTEGRDGGTLQINAHQLALGGAGLQGHVVLGERQRSGAATPATPALLSIGRGLGTLNYLPALALDNAATAALEPAFLADPLQAPNGLLPASTVLSPAALADSGFGRLTLRAGDISQPGYGTLDLGAGGVLSLRAGQSLALDGSYSAAGGSISLQSEGDLRLSASTRLDVAGRWTNDTAGGSGGQAVAAVPVQLNGGAISLQAAQSMQVAAGAALDVSAGAWLNGSGALAKGKAGTMAISALSYAPSAPAGGAWAGVALSAYDFGSGGGLTLGGPALHIGGAADSGYTLAPAFFSEHGFGRITVNATGDVSLASGTQLAPRLLNWQLADAYRTTASGTMAGVAAATLLDPQLGDRSPVNLALSALSFNPSAGAASVASSLRIERGAGITLEPGGALKLTATRNIEIGASGPAGQTAELAARGGSIELDILGLRGGQAISDDPVGFTADQALWLGDGARLSVAGIARLRPEGGSSLFGGSGAPAGPQPEGRVTGSVLGGGTITLNAQRGYVVAQAGATLNLDGSSASLNLPGLAAPVSVAKPAGTLNVSTVEGFVLDAAVSARAPRDTGGRALADGGRLSLSIAVGGAETGTLGPAYPDTLRMALVGDHDGLLARHGTLLGQDLSATLGNGIGYVRSSLLTQAGFDKLALGAGDRVQFDGSLTLDMPLGVQLNSPSIAAAPGVSVQIRTTYAQLGDAAQARVGAPADRGAAADLSADGSTSLRVSAPTVELDGSWGLRGFSQVVFDAGATAGGEIRMATASPTGLSESLHFAGRLELAAAQVYASSGLLYALAGTPAAGPDDAGSTLAIRAGSAGTAGAAAMPPLSAFGGLDFSATNIQQDGVLRQPFGSISLTAQRQLALGAGSVTSVSGEGAAVPYGSTTNLSFWNLGGVDGTSLPRGKGVNLSAAEIRTAATATVSASGGGLVQADEFFAGVGGSKDYFQTPGLYAVLPDHAASLALGLNGSKPDAAEQVRQIVITTPGSGLAPGRYTLLPARYALIGGALPQGAFLVSRAADQGSAVLTQALPRDDGSVVVAGYMSEAGSANVGQPGERFVVEPSATFLARSDIRLSDVSQLLAERARALGNTQTPPLPRDAGQVQVTVSGADSAAWQARLDLGAHGGLAGLLDISATRLALVDDLAKVPLGALGVRADVIANSGAGSALLGGRRSLVAGAEGQTAPTWSIDHSATTAVTVDVGSQSLQVEELLLAARSELSLAAGTHIAATRAATLGARTLASSGDGALLALSANPLALQRGAASLAGGDLQIGAGSVLSGRQLGADASGQLQIDPSARLQAQALDLGARRLVLGAGATDASGASVFEGGLLDALRVAPELTLRSYSSIDFAGSQDWARRQAGRPTQVASRLVLDAPVLRGVAGADGAAASTDIAAQDLVLRNSSGIAADPTPSGQGTLLLQALPALQYGHTGGLTLGPGDTSLGFDGVTLRSGGDLVLQGAGSSHAQGDLRLSAARISASTGASQALRAEGALVVSAEAGSRTLGETVGVGAEVQFSARTLLQQGWIDLPGGKLALQAQGADSSSAAIRFDAGSLTSVAGFTLAGPGGFDALGLAGSLSASAAQGRIDLLGRLDASAAAGGGDAGSITLSAAGAGGQLVWSEGATQGSLRAQAGRGAADLGGQLAIDVTGMASADAVAQLAAQAGTTRSIELRVRSGDVTLDHDLQARRILLSADAGSLRLGGATLHAAAPAGGLVQLTAGDDLQLGAGARIDARSLRAGANGGDVLLASRAGRVRLAAGAQVDAGGDGADDGRIVLRAPRGTASVGVDALDSSQLRAGSVDIEAVRIYTGIGTLSNGSASPAGTLTQATLRANDNAFMANKAAVLSSLGIVSADSARVHLRAGDEIQSSGNLSISGDWSFAGTTAAPNLDRPGGDAGFLTLRAAGNLLVSGSLSDGFSTAAAAGVLNDNARSWSFRLAAGADLTAANPLAVRDLAAGSNGDLSVAAGKLVRTGGGSIELAAGRDIVFAAGSGNTAQGQAYVAGRKSAELAGLLSGVFSGQGAKPTYTEQGGRLDLDAGRDIVSAEATQLMNNWLWRSGVVSASSYANSSQFGWWSEFSRFRQTLASFGGGNLSATAGRDILNLQAMVPSAAWADSRVVADAALQVRNGGDLNVTAGRSLLGGQFLLGHGAGRLRAGADIGAATGNVRAQTPLLGLLDGQWDVAARQELRIGAAFDPSAVSVPTADNRGVVSGYFYTWGGDAALSLHATAGPVTLLGELDNARITGYGLTNSGTGLTQPQVLFQVLPASLSVTATGGGVRLFDGGNAGLLFPSASGNLSVWAAGDLALQRSIAMADTGVDSWPDFQRPLTVSGATLSLQALSGTGGLIPGTLAKLLPGASLHAEDPVPVRLHAEGSITAQALDRFATLVLPKPAEITAGQDILGLQLQGQNLRAGDSTVVNAGRNLLAGLYGELQLAGPGALDVSAGRLVDLGASKGITTIGNQANAALPAAGASVRLAAASAGTLDLAALQANHLQADANPRAAQYRALLLASVRDALHQPGLDYEQAWALFQTFPASAQAALGRQVLAAEFGAVYLSGSTPTEAQMRAALQAAFERHKAEVLQAGADALAAGGGLTLPGREVLKDAALSAYLAELRGLSFAGVDIDAAVSARVASLAQARSGWRDAVAASLGGQASELDRLAPQDPRALAWRAALQDFSGSRFEHYRQQVLAQELSSAGAAASLYGRKSLPMRQALFDQGFQAAELAGAGSFAAQPLWQGQRPLLAYTGSLDMTQSSVVTERGGAISLLNPGGAINVGLKDNEGGSNQAKGVIALGGGDVFGLARGDFQVNNQRVFVVGQGNMTIWSSAGDIDSGRGANTAVAAPPLAARRSGDGIVFEVPATTTGSGLGILEDARGRRAGAIGLYPAFGEILALDAFIRAPSVVLGSTIRGADNLQAASVGGAAAPVSAPALTVAPPANNTDTKLAAQAGAAAGGETRQRSSLLTVELLGLGQAAGEETCTEQDERDRKCKRALPECSNAQRASGQCK